VSILETLQYEKELCEIEVRNEKVAEWYRENPEELQKAVGRLNNFKYRVVTSSIKDCYKDSMIDTVNKSFELLRYKADVGQKKEGGGILSYLIPLGLMLAPLILNEIFPERVVRDEPSGKG
jgi:hypothetical protein